MKVMVNGLPGNMATRVANKILDSSDLTLFPYSLTGPQITQDKISVRDLEISLLLPHERDKLVKSNVGGILERPDIIVDYTHPSAVESNVLFYCNNSFNFVLGTTGANKDALEGLVKRSHINAVIAPNMAKQIVAFQAAMQYMAENFPDAFKDYNLEIIESHQEGKADTSGTAKAMVKYFNQLGIPFSNDQIQMIRNPEVQSELGVPINALKGHGWHTYNLRSSKGDVSFQFVHNVNGRDVYADGTLDAIRFLAKTIDSFPRGKVYSMIDVLKGK